MSLQCPIDLSSSDMEEGIHYSKELLNSYLRLTSPIKICADIFSSGYYLARAESEVHESIALEKFKLKLKDVLDGAVDDRKNSWINRLNKNLKNGNDAAVASMLASLWRRYLSETSLRRSEKSVFGFIVNGNQRTKTHREEEINGLCEFCHKEIMVPVDKGFTCPHCNTYFADFKPQKMKIKPNFENVYFDDFEENDEKSTFQKIETGEFELKKAKKKDAGQLAFTFVFGLGA